MDSCKKDPEGNGKLPAKAKGEEDSSEEESEENDNNEFSKEVLCNDGVRRNEDADGYSSEKDGESKEDKKRVAHRRAAQRFTQRKKNEEEILRKKLDNQFLANSKLREKLKTLDAEVSALVDQRNQLRAHFEKLSGGASNPCPSTISDGRISNNAASLSSAHHERDANPVASLPIRRTMASIDPSAMIIAQRTANAKPHALSQIPLQLGARFTSHPCNSLQLQGAPLSQHAVLGANYVLPRTTVASATRTASGTSSQAVVCNAPTAPSQRESALNPMMQTVFVPTEVRAGDGNDKDTSSNENQRDDGQPVPPLHSGAEDGSKGTVIRDTSESNPSSSQ